jgi:hypothetical protein
VVCPFFFVSGVYDAGKFGRNIKCTPVPATLIIELNHRDVEFMTVHRHSFSELGEFGMFHAAYFFII